MMMNQMFHILPVSPWPILSSLNLMNIAMSMIYLISSSLKWKILLIWIVMMIIIMTMWWSDILSETIMNGDHTLKVNMGLSMGMVMFIVSELMFFFSFFWMYFYLSLSPDIELMMNWPPYGVEKVSYSDLPLLNTAILLLSGFFVTWSHYSVMMGKMYNFFKSLYFCIFLGIYFSIIQLYEYFQASFDFSMSSFGSAFFILTGFHGFHVIVGITFLMVNLLMFKNNQKSFLILTSFDFSIWYWHFVDIIWMFLFIVIYWWKT
uniref:Cytochrome c oxidase subunit 3 n=1 Tax=Vasdavidius concursus TaxID=290153 RepID=Q68PI7_9HEMI|nr:cytochrome oxidase subunit III [Vasdavidius concursus]